MVINQSSQLIGLSLSFCISDLLLKEVELDNVLKMYVSCVWKSEQELEELLKKYHQLHWNKFDFLEVQQIIKCLLPKIEIPQLFNPPRYPNSFKGHWVTNESDIVWHIYNTERKTWMFNQRL